MPRYWFHFDHEPATYINVSDDNEV